MTVTSAILFGITFASFMAVCILYAISVGRGYPLKIQLLNLLFLLITGAAAAFNFVAWVEL